MTVSLDIQDDQNSAHKQWVPSSLSEHILGKVGKMRVEGYKILVFHEIMQKKKYRSRNIHV